MSLTRAEWIQMHDELIAIRNDLYTARMTDVYRRAVIKKLKKIEAMIESVIGQLTRQV